MKRAALKTTYVCRNCGHTPSKWEGRCSRCGTWNSVDEHAAAAAVHTAGRRFTSPVIAPELESVELSEVPGDDAPRIATGIGELDRVLGGGMVPGSTALIAGDPGIGKSTLLLQTAAAIARQGRTVLYASGEESAGQIKLRAGRLGLEGKGVHLIGTGDCSEIAAHMGSKHPAVVIVDSIQTAYLTDGVAGLGAGGASSRGTVTQIRESAAYLSEQARMSGAALVLTGHVTKDGAIAGPKVLEHMVDAVLQMEGEPGGVLRLLRGVKNRFGPTDEIGVFEMRGDGLAEVADPSQLFLAHRQASTPGSAVATILEGTRLITVEIQALVTPSALPSPRRVSNGIEMSRLLLISAVLTKRLRLPVATSDIVVNVAGGLRVREPAADLAVALAIVSSLTDRPVDPGMAAAGEVGLGGELRPVPQPSRRASEARRLGFNGCLLPEGGRDAEDGIATGRDAPSGRGTKGMIAVATLSEAVRAAIPEPDDKPGHSKGLSHGRQ
ncbi:MAG: DNA repair protein RadA [Dehalococcoidia bacterium]|nr:DNA repair protein RadA [Dehalococcoidia bacterium]MSQ35440.1 DNA repair protein RadA [Dehalococcoidia bacterium]